MAGRGRRAGSRTGEPAAAADSEAAAHPTAALSELVHQRHRLGILTITARSRQADFGYLREALSLT
jgi:hypothetical protein